MLHIFYSLGIARSQHIGTEMTAVGPFKNYA